MLKETQLLRAMGDIAGEDIMAAGRRLGYQTAGRRRRLPARTALLAAALAALFTVTAFAAGWLGLRERATPTEEIVVTGEDGETRRSGETGLLFGGGGAESSAAKASLAWKEYREARLDKMRLSNNDAENWHPDGEELRKIQQIYGAYDEAAMQKLLELRDTYGVTLHTDMVVPVSTEDFLRATGLQPFMPGGMDGWPLAYVYEDGSFQAEGGVTADGLSYTVYCGRKGTLDPAYLPVWHMEDYTERGYTNQSGDELGLALGEGHGFLFYESKDYLITVQSYGEELERLADSFDFSKMSALRPDLSSVLNTRPNAVKPKEGLMTLRDFVATDEYEAASAFQTLYNNYALPTQNERLAVNGGSHPEGYSELYYYGGFPTGIGEVDRGLTDILREHPLTPAGTARVIWWGLPLQSGDVLPDGGIKSDAYDAAEGTELDQAARLAAFGCGDFLNGGKLVSVITWENGARYCDFRLDGLGGILHYIPKGAFYPLLHFVLHPDKEGWAYDTACGEQVYITTDDKIEYPTLPASYILYETDTAYVVIQGDSEASLQERIADAIDFTKFA